MSFICRKCGGLALEGAEHQQAWGYGGKWCYCTDPQPRTERTDARCIHCGKPAFRQELPSDKAL